MRVSPTLFAILCAGSPAPAIASDWPTVHGNAARDGATGDCVEPPYSRKWIRSWPLEIMTTRAEAIVGGGRVFAGTYQGRLHALDAGTGADLWTFQADGPLLHSPAYAGGLVYFASASPGSTVYCLPEARGAPRFAARGGEGGFCASPLLAGGRLCLGGRDGVFYAFDPGSGDLLWKFSTGGPIRNTAAAALHRVFFASDDLHAYALDLRTGKLLWKSAKLYGQSLRDFYPVVLGNWVVFRTNPMEQMGVHLRRSYELVGRNAGLDLSSWRNVDAYLKSGKGRGDPQAWEKEARAVLEYLESHPQARTFYLLDAENGEERARAPVLWGAGCQGVGPPPVSAGAGRAIAFTRTALGNWSLGVAPLVGLEYLELGLPLRAGGSAAGALPAVESRPLLHAGGPQPPWNTFWGTADETTVYSRGGRLLYACHQGTIAALDLDSGRLIPVAGKRDSWGGEKSLPWARNEWHGPARGSLAISGDSLYWVTGSRVVAIRGRAAGRSGAESSSAEKAAPSAEATPAPVTDPVAALPAPPHPSGPLPPAEEFLRFALERPAARPEPRETAATAALREKLERRVREFLEAPELAPLLVEIGLGSHGFFFDSSGETVRALSLAYPHLSAGLAQRVKERVRKELETHPLCGSESRYPLDHGRRRELYTITSERFFRGWEERPPLADAYVLDLYGERTGDWEPVERLWPRAGKALRELLAREWKLDGRKGERFQNALLAGLIGAARLANRFGDPEAARAASTSAAAQLRRLCQEWRESAARIPSQEITGVSEVDRFIKAGDSLFQVIAPHRAKIARFLDLTPEVARCLREYAAAEVKYYLAWAEAVIPGWYLAFEERQVHFGENYLDFPDQALAIFQARALLGGDGRAALESRLDLPWCEGDLYYLEKLVLAIEAEGA